jgi:hypothetical protein
MRYPSNEDQDSYHHVHILGSSEKLPQINFVISMRAITFWYVYLLWVVSSWLIPYFLMFVSVVILWI